MAGAHPATGLTLIRKLVVAPRHPTTLFDRAEEPPDPTAGAVEIGAEADWIAPIAFGQDVGPLPYEQRKVVFRSGQVR